VSFSFNSLVNMIDLDLLKREDNNLVNVARSTLTSQRSMSGSTTATRLIVKTISAGSYVMRLSSPSFSSPIDLKQTVFCMPFTYIVQIMPLDGTPYVSDVNPALARGLSPSKPLTLLLRFSESVYDVQTSDRADASAIKDVFGLACIKKEDEELALPSTVVPASTDSTMWALNFDATTFESLSTYKLEFTGSDRLADDEGQNVSYTLVNLYSTLDSTCSGHGTLDNVSGECRCEEAYAGTTCNSCNLGYMRVQGPDPDSVRCVPAVKCEEDTCGCDYSGGDSCIPLGNCYIDRDDGRARCQCKEGYTGAYCRECSEGFIGWPTCERCKNGGVWDAERSRCDCPTGFTGDFCKECSFGHSGPECTANAVIPLLVIGLLILFAGLAVGGVFVYNKYFKHREPAPYELLSTNGDDDEDGLKSNGVIDTTREKLDFGPEIDGDDDDDLFVDAEPAEIVVPKKEAEEKPEKPEKPEEEQPQQKPVVDILTGDDPIDDDDDDFFAYNKH